MDLLKKLCETDGMSGYEDAIRALVHEAMAPYCQEIEADAMGNLIGRRLSRESSATQRSVMIAAHMDEIGFMVSHVDEERGFLRINPVGGFDPKTLVAQRVKVHTESGPILGVVGSTPVHIMTDAEKAQKPELKQYYVDVGLTGEAAKERIDIGDMVTLERSFEELGDAVTGKALDDRAGVYVMLETLKRLGNEPLDVEVVAVATVQEEVGLRGAQTSAFGVQPDLAVALDVTVASDVPDAKTHEYVSELGRGVAIKLMDGSSISDRAMVKKLRSLAKEKEIAHQLEILPRGGTDAGAIQRSRAGVRTVTLSIPTRFLHTTVETAKGKDIEAAVQLLVEFLRSAHQID